MQYAWNGCVHHLQSPSGVFSCRTWGCIFVLWTNQLQEMMGKLIWRDAAMQKTLQGSPSVGHKLFSFSWAHRTAWGYHPTTKPSISPRLLYHSPMLCLMKFRKNLWPNSHISHLVWDHSQIPNCGRCKQIMTLQFYQATELHTVKCIWSFRSGRFSDRHITFRISIYEKFNSVRL